MSNIIAIDPGLSGAFAILDKDTQVILHTQHMPTIRVGDRTELDESAIVRFFKLYKPEHAFIESVHAIPIWGSTASFQLGMTYGFIRAILACLEIPYTKIKPQAWKKALMEGMSKDKGASIVRVKQLYPSIVLNLKKDHNIADAILIGRYGIALKIL
jgi:crossover junction endodeoxyribonuclease RuvC